MGKKLDALLGRGFRTSKFKSTVSLAISRLAVLKNQHQARYSVARSDIVQMLNLGHHERAFLRVDQVIKEQNMLDSFAMIEEYCHLLKERVSLLVQAKECPEELKEAISSMIYAASRCGQFPELQKLREVFTSRFKKEFVARAVELRNNCGVSPKMVQRLSTRMPSLENRVKVLKEIASENNIVLQIEEAGSEVTEEEMEAKRNEEEPEANVSNDRGNSGHGVNKAIVIGGGTIEGLSISIKTRRKYKDVADAAQAAFESAAYAADAARAAVEFSRSDSHDTDDSRSLYLQPRKLADSPGHIESEPQTSQTKDFRGMEDLDNGVGSEKVHHVQNYFCESEDDEVHTHHVQNYFSKSEDDEVHTQNKPEEFEPSKEETGHTSNMDETENIVKETIASDEGRMSLQRTKVLFDQSDNETKNISRVGDSSKNLTPPADDVLSSKNVRNVEDNAAVESKALSRSE